MWVLARVMHVPPNDDALTQPGLSDRQVDRIVAAAAAASSAPTRGTSAAAVAAAAAAASPTTTSAPRVARKPLAEDTTCPICQDDMSVTERLVWCQDGCGNNIHDKCFRVYLQHAASKEGAVSCPLCRGVWRPEDGETAASGGGGGGGGATAAPPTPPPLPAAASSRHPAVPPGTRCRLGGPAPRYGAPDASPGGPAPPFQACSRCYNSPAFLRATTCRAGAPHTAMAFRGAPRDAWRPALHPSARDALPPALADLQFRELTAADYDALLALDAADAPPSLAECVTRAAAAAAGTEVPPGGWDPCAYCGAAVVVAVTSGTSTSAAQSSVSRSAPLQPLQPVALPCRHIAHATCLTEALPTTSVSDADAAACRCPTCAAPLLPGLAPPPPPPSRPPVPRADTAASSSGRDVLDSVPDLVIGSVSVALPRSQSAGGVAAGGGSGGGSGRGARRGGGRRPVAGAGGGRRRPPPPVCHAPRAALTGTGVGTGTITAGATSRAGGGAPGGPPVRRGASASTLPPAHDLDLHIAPVALASTTTLRRK